MSFKLSSESEGADNTFFHPYQAFFLLFERKVTKNFLTLHTNRVLNKLKKGDRTRILPIFSTLRCHTDNSI